MASEEYIEGTKGPAFPNGWPTDVDIKTYDGGCHCGKFCYTFEFPSLKKAPAIQCNCTSCSMNGALMAHPPLSKFHLSRGTFDELSKYQYNRKVVTHYFCPVCGSQMFSFLPALNIATVNLNTVNNVDISKLCIQKFDARSL